MKPCSNEVVLLSLSWGQWYRGSGASTLPHTLLLTSNTVCYIWPHTVLLTSNTFIWPNTILWTVKYCFMWPHRGLLAVNHLLFLNTEDGWLIRFNQLLELIWATHLYIYIILYSTVNCKHGLTFQDGRLVGCLTRLNQLLTSALSCPHWYKYFSFKLIYSSL